MENLRRDDDLRSWKDMGAYFFQLKRDKQPIIHRNLFATTCLLMGGVQPDSVTWASPRRTKTVCLVMW